MTSDGKFNGSAIEPPKFEDVLTEVQRQALAGILADEQHELERERKLIEAQAQAIFADLRTAMAEWRNNMEARVTERLAKLQNGRDGAIGPIGEKGDRGDKGDAGEAGQAGKDGAAGDCGERGEPGLQGEAGPAGKDGAPGERGEIGFPGLQGMAGERGERGATGSDGAPGAPGAPGERGEIGFPGLQGAAGERGEKGLPGEPGAPGARGERGESGAIGQRGERGEIGVSGKDGAAGVPGIAGERGSMGEKGDAGPRGEQGEQGELPAVKLYLPNVVHYAGDVVAFDGGTFQARKDTGLSPDHSDDWICLAVAGRDGRSPNVRGTYSASKADSYLALDIVALNGGSFIARQDQPGECPGDGWQSLTMPGKRGDKGERGLRGERGERGLHGEPGPPAPPTPTIIGWKIDREAFVARALMSDESESPPLQLRPLFEEFHSQSR